MFSAAPSLLWVNYETARDINVASALSAHDWREPLAKVGRICDWEELGSDHLISSPVDKADLPSMTTGYRSFWVCAIEEATTIAQTKIR